MTSYQYQAPPRRFATFPPVIRWLLILCVALFLCQLIPALNQYLLTYLALWPIGSPAYVNYGQGLQVIPHFQLWQLITYAFLHGGIAHILMNLFALWMFGAVIENVWGSKRFTLYYLVCVIGAALLQCIVSYGKVYPTIGASGGVFGVLLAFGMMFPNQPIYFILIPVPIPAKYFVIAYGAIELFMGVSGYSPGIAHFAHLGGMLFGFILIQFWRGKLPWKPKPGKLW